MEKHITGTDRRKSARAETRGTIRLRTARQVIPEVVMMDLSVFGCQVAQQGSALEAGQVVVVRPEGMDSLCGKVRWIAGERVGIEFDRPLLPGVMEHLLLAGSYGAVEAVACAIADGGEEGPSLRLCGLRFFKRAT